MESSRLLFTPLELERARRYHRPLYIALLIDATLGLVTLSLMVFTRLGSWLYALVEELPWWGRAPLFPILVLGVLTLLRLPLSFWRGHVRERGWGFLRQTARGWWLDRAKRRRGRGLPDCDRRARFRRARWGTAGGLAGGRFRYRPR